MALPITQFDPSKIPDITSVVSYNYPSLTISGITTTNGGIMATCSKTSSSNVTYVTNNITTEFQATKLYIIGNNANTTPLHSIKGVDFNGELIIENRATTNSAQKLYMCFLLKTDTAVSSTDVDLIISSSYKTPPGNTCIVDINSLKPTSQYNNFIEYNSGSSDLKPIVIIYTNTIHTNSNLDVFNNKLGLTMFTMSPSQSNDYSILLSTLTGSTEEGEWMECDNVPIDSEDVQTYNLPITSGVLKDGEILNSYYNIILSIVFLVFCGLAYFLVPSAYLKIVMIALKQQNALFADQSTKKDIINWVNMALTFMFLGLAVILILIGLFPSPTMTNSNDILLSGLIITILYTIAFIVVTMKRTTTKNFIPGVNYNL